MNHRRPESDHYHMRNQRSGTVRQPKKINQILLILLSVLVVIAVLLVAFPDLLNHARRILKTAGARTDFRKIDIAEQDLNHFSREEISTGVLAWNYSQNMLLVNKRYGLPSDFQPAMKEYKQSGVLMNQAMLEDYARLSAAVTEESGEKMYVSSVYRTHWEQGILHDQSPEIAQRPGHSEHQTGLAADVYVNEFAGARFIDSPAGRFVNDYCWRYGFIIRYPQGKEAITGIPFEPWHIRYVGQPHATVMAAKDWTMEEYFEHLIPGEYYLAEGRLITRQKRDQEILLPVGISDITYGDDNTGHLIITGTYASD